MCEKEKITFLCECLVVSTSVICTNKLYYKFCNGENIISVNNIGPYAYHKCYSCGKLKQRQNMYCIFCYNSLYQK